MNLAIFHSRGLQQIYIVIITKLVTIYILYIIHSNSFKKLKFFSTLKKIFDASIFANNLKST